METILSESKVCPLVVLQGEVLFSECDLLLWCLLGHCEGCHELLQGQVEEMPCVRDNAKSIAGGNAVK